MSNEQMSMKRPRVRRAQTRERLIEAAGEVIGERGIAAATLDEIAARVGLTKGAIYDNFESKDDLILAMVIAKAARASVPEFAPGSSLKQKMRAIGQAIAAFAPAANAQGIASAELDLYALTHEAMRSRLAGFYVRRIDMTAVMLAEIDKSTPLPMPVDQFATLVCVVATGLIHLRLWSPERITDAFIVSAFEALAPEGT
jgi:AcrR family transcriptional regulator